jgi:hypothetical protein
MKAGPRGARIYEELRLRTEQHATAGGKTPRVLLAEIGEVKMRAQTSRQASLPALDSRRLYGGSGRPQKLLWRRAT